MRRALATLALALLVGSPAQAVRFRRPFHPDARVTAHYDGDRRVGPQKDNQCGNETYDNHTGTDFGVYYTDVLAVANGTVEYTSQGCADTGYYGNQCGNRCGNQVYLRLDDGTHALYCHLKNGSIVVGGGQRVSCGQKLAISASSGSSTGAHLHLTWNRGGATADNYAGPCSASGGVWVQQRGYLQSPGTDCESTCECSPGQVEARGCGRCGAQRRVCGGNCQWGGFGGCEGEGPCAPGQVDDERCCDCGSRRRTCNGSCQWNGFGACDGPDPAGSPACDTGAKGVCREGHRRCVGGCLTCVQSTPPSDERCDDLDNDCDGETDEGSPARLGDVPPAFAARLVDASFPRHLAPGEQDTAWLVFRNVGRSVWPARSTSLRADRAADGLPSPLAPASGWRAWDTPSVLDRDVPPGGEAAFVFPVRLGPEAASDAVESFSLLTPAGAPVRCPEGTGTITVASAPAMVLRRVEGPDAPHEPGDQGCRSIPLGALSLVPIGLARRRRR